MKKLPKIHEKYLPVNFGLTNIVAYMYLWDKFSAEWFRTLLSLLIALHVVMFIIDTWFASDRNKDLVFEN